MTTPTSSPHFDLNGVLNLQKNYALDLTKVSIDADKDKNNESAIGVLTKNLNNMTSNLADSQTSAQAVLYKQKIVNDILDTEKKRLDDKKKNIESAMQGQKRMIDLNDNYQKRYAAYTKIMIAIVVGLVIYIFMDKLMVLMPFIPQIVFYLIIIIILGGIIFYVYLVWIDIKRRELTNYDELALPAPDLSGTPSSARFGADSTLTPAGSDKDRVDYSNCKGSECCGYDQDGYRLTWSETTGCTY